MATFNLRRFSNPEALKTIDRVRLIEFLSPHAVFFEKRGLPLPGESTEDEIDFESLSEILMSPDQDTPKDLADALYVINEMSTPHAMDCLLEAAGAEIDDHAEQAPSDIAMQVWLQDRELLERKHAEQFLFRPRSFEYYQTSARPVPTFAAPDDATLRRLEADLDRWFESKKRGRGARVFMFVRGDGAWFLVRHGNPFRREGALEGERSSSVLYRPETFDVVVYDPKIGEMRVNAGSKGEKQLYRSMFGRHLFDDDDFFPGQEKYTLDPLRNDGADSVVVGDVEGLEWVRLREVQFYWGGAEHEIEVRRADDLFAALGRREKAMPRSPKIIRAGFQVKFTDCKTPRALTIKPPFAAQFTRDSDSVHLEEWLTKRGFCRNGDTHGDGE